MFECLLLTVIVIIIIGQLLTEKENSMKQTINFNQFADAFSTRGGNFSYNGLRALYDFIEEVDEEGSTETELDVIALCCEFSEYDSAIQAAGGYGFDYPDKTASIEAIEEDCLDYLHGNTLVIRFDGGIIIQDF
jgi:hypothetical protein